MKGTWPLVFLALSGSALAAEGWLVDELTDTLQTFDSTTLTIRDVGPLGTPFAFGDLAWDHETATLWMVDGRGLDGLWRVDTTTGTATLVGGHGIADMAALVWDPVTGKLFASAASPRGLYELDKTSGAATFLGDPGFHFDSIAYDHATSELIGMEAGFGAIASIDPVFGTATELARPGFVNNFGWDMDPATGTYFAATWDSRIREYDPGAGWAFADLLVTSGPKDGLTFSDEGAAGLLLSIAGSCPGPVIIEGSGFAPGEAVAFYRGTGTGSAPLPVGPCAGTSTDFASLKAYHGTATANMAGEVRISPTVPGFACGQGLQLQSLGSCDFTNVDVF